MIRSEEVFKIGYIAKFRGISGEVELNFTDDAFDRGTAEYLVLDIDGIFVPFFWEEYRFKNNETAIVKFEDIDDETTARKLVGRSVWYPHAHVGDEPEELRSWKAFVGFRVSDEENGCLGTVIDVDDSSANVLFTIEREDGGELLIPFHNDFLVDYNIKERTLVLHLPEGLLDLN